MKHLIRLIIGALYLSTVYLLCLLLGQSEILAIALIISNVLIHAYSVGYLVSKNLPKE